jgi:hypothetical protein
LLLEKETVITKLDDPKERKRQKDRENYSKNREKILERKRQYRLKNPEKTKQWSKDHYEANKKDYIERAAEKKRSQRAEWDEFKNTLSCTQCGENHPATLDFHHVVRDPSNHKVHRLVANGSITKAREEIKKCVVLCSNCHRKHHYDEYQEKIKARKKKKGAKKPPPSEQV